MDLIRRHLLWLALAVQVLLMLPRLDLLPQWDDERHTLKTAGLPPARIVRAVQVDVHPPLYFFLVKAWWKLPLPGDRLVQTRALSVAATLAATVVFGRLWLRRLEWTRQALFLALWVASPCLVLYGRMARSYALQALVALVAIRYAVDWLREPENRRAEAGFAAFSALLLYLHYLPGLAVLASTTALGLWRGEWRRLRALGWIGLLYLPWIVTLVRTAGRVAEAEPYRVGGNWMLENALKLGYAFVAFQFGETVPVWAWAAALALLPAIGAALWRAWRRSAHAPTLFLALAGVGYFVAASWVSFAFVGARLLFLLPFYYLFLVRGLDMTRPVGVLTMVGLLAVAVGGLGSYYRKQDFLNKGYLVDFDQIGRDVLAQTAGESAYVLLDRFCSSAGYTLHGPSVQYLKTVTNAADLREALDGIARDWPARVWHVRYTRQAAVPDHLEPRLARDYQVVRHGYVPYSTLDRAAMRLIGFAAQPAYVVEAVEFRRFRR